LRSVTRALVLVDDRLTSVGETVKFEADAA
jgi:hypothetical protein